MLRNISAEQFQKSRNAYTYPTVALDDTPANPRMKKFNATVALDNYLKDLLHSAIDSDRILGYLGVIFWGHYSGQAGKVTHNRALGKVNLAYKGHQGKKRQIRGFLDIGEPEVVKFIIKAIDRINQNQFNLALAELCNLPQIQIAFASKICAFINPNSCGVIDSVIAKNYPQFNFELNQKGFVKGTIANFNLYNNYCICLQETAVRLNKNPIYSTWTDIDGKHYSWRALDVERAIFGLIAPSVAQFFDPIQANVTVCQVCGIRPATTNRIIPDTWEMTVKKLPACRQCAAKPPEYMT